ncbi:MAG: VOC family protein [Janthinobacterium lividum]
MADRDFITFGAVHLEVRDPERTARFWEELFGFERRAGDGTGIAVGTAEETLLVLHAGARVPFQQGHSGIYHVAVHPPNARDFARIFKRLVDHKYPMSPTDHTFSKAIYLDDPDGINMEITLETPERFRECVPGPGNRLTFVGADGVGRPGAYALDLNQVFEAYEPGSEHEPAAPGTKIGHIHLYVGNLEKARDFYTGLGMQLARWWPPMQIADLGAGGPFTHRIAINTWQGIGAPPAPAGSARMRHFEIGFATPERLRFALNANPAAVDLGDGYEVTDPSGNRLRLLKTPALPVA